MTEDLCNLVGEFIKGIILGRVDLLKAAFNPRPFIYSWNAFAQGLHLRAALVDGIKYSMSPKFLDDVILLHVGVKMDSTCQPFARVCEKGLNPYKLAQDTKGVKTLWEIK